MEKRKDAPTQEGLLQPMHLLLIFGIALLVFGPKKLPELGKGQGEAIRGFKASFAEDEKTPKATTLPGTGPTARPTRHPNGRAPVTRARAAI
jgi:sec-independent protein translocase protein TatA